MLVRWLSNLGGLVNSFVVFVFNRVLVETFAPVYSVLQCAFILTLCLNVSYSVLIYFCFGGINFSYEDVGISFLICVFITFGDNRGVILDRVKCFWGLRHLRNYVLIVFIYFREHFVKQVIKLHVHCHLRRHRLFWSQILWACSWQRIWLLRGHILLCEYKATLSCLFLTLCTGDRAWALFVLVRLITFIDLSV